MAAMTSYTNQHGGDDVIYKLPYQQNSLPIRIKPSGEIGSFSDVNSWNMVIAISTVMHSEILSPDSAGKTKVKNTIQAITAHGKTRLIK
jgi:hypothetical protein